MHSSLERECHMSQHGHWAVEEITESFAGDVAGFTEEYFGKRLITEEMVMDYEKLLQEVRETLEQIARTKHS